MRGITTNAPRALTRSGSDPELEAEALDGLPVDELLEVGVEGELDLAAAHLRREARDLRLQHEEERLGCGERPRALQRGAHLQRNQRAEAALVEHAEREARMPRARDRIDGARFREADSRRLGRERARAASDV